MSKQSTKFVCQSCGYESAKWMGRCPDCGEWASLVEETVRVASPASRSSRRSSGTPAAIQLTEVSDYSHDRVHSGFSELDRVLGGGIVPGSLVLVGGDPGIGKSTLLLQVSGYLAGVGQKVLYIAGEESPQQIKMRASRLQVPADGIWLSSETDAGQLEDLVKSTGADALVIDSIQTMTDPAVPSAPGTVSQVRGAAGYIAATAKPAGVAAFIVGHVTKEGSIAGPRVLEHMVDTVLYFEGERDNAYRILRSVKNRFGATDEVGIFEMRSSGLVEVSNPSLALLGEREPGASGSAVCPTLEGTRPLLVEVQALAAPTHFAAPRRMAAGMDFNRFLLVLAVLEKRGRLKLGQSDVYANITGGLKVTEPALDLAVAVAVASSVRDVPVQPGVAVMGEIGLGGEVRGVAQAERRVREAQRLGFELVVTSRRDARDASSVGGIKCIGVKTVAEAVHIALEGL